MAGTPEDQDREASEQDQYQEIKSRHGFDIGEYDDAPKKHQPKPVYKRVKCPHCDAKPKEQGLWQHVRDVHGISKVEQALGKVPDNAELSGREAIRS